MADNVLANTATGIAGMQMRDWQVSQHGWPALVVVLSTTGDEYRMHVRHLDNDPPENVQDKIALVIDKLGSVKVTHDECE